MSRGRRRSGVLSIGGFALLTLIRNDDYPGSCRELLDRFTAPVRIGCDDLTRTRRTVLGDLTVLSCADGSRVADPASDAYRLICSLGRARDVRAESVLTLSDSSFTGEPAGDWVMV